MSSTPIAKYGHPLEDSQWIGLPLRVGTFPGTGHVEDLVTDTDAVLVWSGGRTEVTLHASVAGRTPRARYHFVRESGRVDLLPRGTTLHDITWTGEPFSCVSVNLTPASLAHVFEDVEAGLSPEGGPRFNLVDAHVVDLVQRLFVQATSEEPLNASYAQALSIALVSYVVGTFGNRAQRPMAQLPAIETNKLVAFVEEHLGSNLGLVDLATLVGYSPDHFARLFKQSFGVSPHRYITSRRVERAKTMLRDRSQPLAQVAAACGFSTQAHFNAVFKQHAGMTPGAYRKG